MFWNTKACSSINEVVRLRHLWINSKWSPTLLTDAQHLTSEKFDPPYHGKFVKLNMFMMHSDPLAVNNNLRNQMVGAVLVLTYFCHINVKLLWSGQPSSITNFHT